MIATCTSFDPTVKDGKCTFYYENGNKKSEGNFTANELTGIWIFYFESGKKKSEGNYTAGKETGTWTWWDENENDSTIAEIKSDGTKRYTRYSKNFLNETIFTIVEEMPVYPGGREEMNKFISKQFNATQKEIKKYGTGTFYIKFIIDANGNAIIPEINKSICKEYDEKALEMFKKMPRWSPGKQNDKAVKVYLMLPVRVS